MFLSGVRPRSGYRCQKFGNNISYIFLFTVHVSGVKEMRQQLSVNLAKAKPTTLITTSTLITCSLTTT